MDPPEEEREGAEEGGADGKRRSGNGECEKSFIGAGELLSHANGLWKMPKFSTKINLPMREGSR